MVVCQEVNYAYRRGERMWLGIEPLVDVDGRSFLDLRHDGSANKVGINPKVRSWRALLTMPLFERLDAAPVDGWSPTR